MNRELFRKVADSIEFSEKLSYDQTGWLGSLSDSTKVVNPDIHCGSCACVAGHAVFVVEGFDALSDADATGECGDKAARLLDIPYRCERVLFAAQPNGVFVNATFGIPAEHHVSQRPSFAGLFDELEEDLAADEAARLERADAKWMANVLRTIADHAPDTSYDDPYA